MPSPHWRQPRVLRLNPAAVVSFMAPSSTESPTISGARPWLRLWAVWRIWMPPQPAWAAGAPDQSRQPRTTARTGERRFMPPETLPFAPAPGHGLSLDRVRRLLPCGAGHLVAAHAAARVAQAVPDLRQLRLLRGGEPEVLPAAGRRDARQPALRHPDRPQRQRAPSQGPRRRRG